MSLLENLKAFNRKERFLLIGLALGNQNFALGDEFCSRLGETFGLTVPSGAFVAMDYHLDWLYASLRVDSTEDFETTYDNRDRIIEANQEDVDLLVAYSLADETHVIMLECKGVTGWTNSQFLSKAERLGKYFDSPESRTARVVPHIALVSPRYPRGLKVDHLPGWMLEGTRVRHIPLDIPGGLVSVTRCNRHGAVTKTGRYWRLRPGFSYPAAKTEAGPAG